MPSSPKGHAALLVPLDPLPSLVWTLGSSLPRAGVGTGQADPGALPALLAGSQSLGGGGGYWAVVVLFVVGLFAVGAIILYKFKRQDLRSAGAGRLGAGLGGEEACGGAAWDGSVCGLGQLLHLFPRGSLPTGAAGTRLGLLPMWDALKPQERTPVQSHRSACHTDHSWTLGPC